MEQTQNYFKATPLSKRTHFKSLYVDAANKKKMFKLFHLKKNILREKDTTKLKKKTLI